jgi:FkbM family methyltransferase
LERPSVVKIHESLHIHKRIKLLVEKYLGLNGIHHIWEIGALDGSDSVALKTFFPKALFTAFEPTPTSFQIVIKNLESIGGIDFQYAIALEDSSTSFFVNDSEKTVTTWIDGNQGANSMFRANLEYPIEQYFQNEITVEAKRADTLISKGLTCPNLLWIDAQGSELNILRSFGKNLDNVDFIYTELSLFPIYKDAPLAEEIINFLWTQGFYWVTNLTTGGFQFDAVLIRVKKRRFIATIKHRYFTYSLHTKSKLYISTNLRQLIRAKIGRYAKSTLRLLNNKP